MQGTKRARITGTDAMEKSGLYGIMAEFDSADNIREAAQRAYAVGYRRLDAYTPFPVEGLSDAIGFRHSGVPLLVFFGGIFGALAGYFLQYWINVIDYPILIGGRPHHSIPAFIIVTFECTILAASLAAVIGMLLLNGLPKPYHPVFNAPRFALASHDRFFLCIESRDPKFDAQATRQFLQSLNPREVSDVEP